LPPLYLLNVYNLHQPQNQQKTAGKADLMAQMNPLSLNADKPADFR
jgi:hypothetical protein